MIESNRVSGDPLAKAGSHGVKRGERQENWEAWGWLCPARKLPAFQQAAGTLKAQLVCGPAVG